MSVHAEWFDASITTVEIVEEGAELGEGTVDAGERAIVIAGDELAVIAGTPDTLHAFAVHALDVIGQLAPLTFEQIQVAYLEAARTYTAALHREIVRAVLNAHPTAIAFKVQGEFNFGGFTVSLGSVLDAQCEELPYDAPFENALWELLDQLGSLDPDYQGDYTYTLSLTSTPVDASSGDNA